MKPQLRLGLRQAGKHTLVPGRRVSTWITDHRLRDNMRKAFEMNCYPKHYDTGLEMPCHTINYVTGITSWHFTARFYPLPPQDFSYHAVLRSETP